MKEVPKPWLYLGTSENDRKALNYFEEMKIDFVLMPVPDDEISNEKPPKVLHDLHEYQGPEEIKWFIDLYKESLPKRES